MDFGFTIDQLAFQEKVRSFMDEEVAAGRITPRSNNFYDPDPEFSKKFAEKKWIGLTWPKEHGGQGASYVDRTILMEEVLRVQAPIGLHFSADRQVGPSLVHFGTDKQRAEFLPEILAGKISFCLLFSEPGAGSDLVSVMTTARQDGDYWVITGQKLWTSGAQHSDYGWILVRTDPEAPSKHKGLSEFIVDMKSPGITIRPIINIAGEHHFNEIFFEEVRVHKDYLVGQEGRGFYQIMQQMDYERAGIERLMHNFPLFTHLKEYVSGAERDGKPLSADPLVRDQMAQLEIDFQAGRLLCYQIAWHLDQGRIPNWEAALCKAYCTQFKRRLADTATQIMGPFGQLMPGSPHSPSDGEAALIYLYGHSYTLQGGTVEILKNIVARRGLKLPMAR